MYQYRITKYDPKNRVNGIYIKDEWTSISDIGEIFDGEVFLENEYLKVEHSYINCLFEIMKICDVKKLQIDRLEDHNKLNRWYNKQWITNISLEFFIQDCLREKCWSRLIADNFFVHFGYDYYMYVGCKLIHDEAKKIAGKNNLFCELFDSPYLHLND